LRGNFTRENGGLAKPRDFYADVTRNENEAITTDISGHAMAAINAIAQQANVFGLN